MPWRLLVVDGADTNRFFPLPDGGSMIIGTSHKHADIHLNDLYVARIHCQVDVEDGRVLVTAMADDRDTLVNGMKVRQSELQIGQILRLGNSHLRLEAVSEAGDAEAADVYENFEEVSDDEVLDADVVEDAQDAEVLAVDDVIDTSAPPPPPPKPAAKPAAAAVAADELPDLEWEQLEGLANHTLAHFQVGPPLGRGHYGVVFRAYDTEGRREVALKVIGPDFPEDAAELQRFAKAIKLVSTIQEDHLVRWYAAGKTWRYVWIAQELIEGESLAQILARNETMNKVRWRNSLKMGLDLAKALGALFERRIVHGNVTPANVLLQITDRTTKLNDLMFTQALKGSVWHRRQLEQKMLSELPYLPPERVEPGAYWDGAADIYSLGAVVYARLTGGPPFQGKTPGETIELIRAGNPERPRRFFKDCPEEFERVVLKMLKHNPEERYQTPAQLLEDLERCQTLP